MTDETKAEIKAEIKAAYEQGRSDQRMLRDDLPDRIRRIEYRFAVAFLFASAVILGFIVETTTLENKLDIHSHMLERCITVEREGVEGTCNGAGKPFGTCDGKHIGVHRRYGLFVYDRAAHSTRRVPLAFTLHEDVE